MRARTWGGAPLVPGVNLDAVDISAGLQHAAALGFCSPEDQMVTTYALQRWGRGEEDGAVRTWLSFFPKNLTQWYGVLAAARAGAPATSTTTSSTEATS